MLPVHSAINISVFVLLIFIAFTALLSILGQLDYMKLLPAKSMSQVITL